MSTFRIEAATLRAAVAPTIPAGASEPSDTEVLERFACGAWTVLPEPGDGVAGLVRERLGAVRSLELLVDGASPSAWAAELGDADIAHEVAPAIARWQPRLAAARILGAFGQGAAFGQRLLTRADEAWPDALDDLGPHAPAALWVRGDAGALAACSRSAALVGSRASSGYGELVTGQLAAGLASRRFAVVSGGAYGIDGTAHRATMGAGGTTVAVLAGGLDRFYPAGHDELLQRVADTACVIAEAPSGVPPTRWRFLARNRLIAALASVTVVVEAGSRSGSINTAGHAAALGRPLGAVPGPVTSGSSTGCHRLLREYGAIVIERAEHVAELVDGPSDEPVPLDALSSAEVRVLDALSARAPRAVDEIAVRSGMAPGDVAASLALLELSARAVERGSGWVRAT